MKDLHNELITQHIPSEQINDSMLLPNLTSSSRQQDSLEISSKSAESDVISPRDLVLNFEESKSESSNSNGSSNGESNELSSSQMKEKIHSLGEKVSSYVFYD